MAFHVDLYTLNLAGNKYTLDNCSPCSFALQISFRLTDLTPHISVRRPLHSAPNRTDNLDSLNEVFHSIPRHIAVQRHSTAENISVLCTSGPALVSIQTMPSASSLLIFGKGTAENGKNKPQQQQKSNCEWMRQLESSGLHLVPIYNLFIPGNLL